MPPPQLLGQCRPCGDRVVRCGRTEPRPHRPQLCLHLLGLDQGPVFGCSEDCASEHPGDLIYAERGEQPEEAPEQPLLPRLVAQLGPQLQHLGEGRPRGSRGPVVIEHSLGLG